MSHKTPLEIAKATGQANKQKARFADREVSPMGKLSGVPSHFNALEKKAWTSLIKSMPWLRESDRIQAEATASLYALTLDPKNKPTMQVYNMLRQFTNGLGGSPSTISNVAGALDAMNKAGSDALGDDVKPMDTDKDLNRYFNITH